MNMTNQLTYRSIAVAVFAQQLCLPLPAVLLLVTVGALASQGAGTLHISLVLCAGVSGCLAADGFWFWLGRRWGSSVIRLVCSFTSNPQGSRERSHRIFDKWGLRLLLVAKFVPGLDGVAPPLAGAEGATIGGFLAYDAVGSLLWTGAYIAVGFIFANQLDSVMHVIKRFGMAMAMLFGIPLLFYMVWRAAKMMRMVRHLRLRRISPAMLQTKMNENDKIMVVDLLHYEAQDAAVKGIPGAFRADPTKLRRVKKLTLPEGVEVVLYCSSQNEFVSARVADAMQKTGNTDVWVLEGGLEAWVQDGRAVTSELETGEEVAARVGIVLPEEIRMSNMRHD
jgi:membrane protein DedA with SNARE-associated domain/rhodanese-related sulfurtransferase